MRGDDALEAGPHAGCQRFIGLRAGDDVPALLRKHLQRQRMALRDVLAEGEALPLAEVDLPQVRLDPGFDAESLGKRRGGFRGAAQGGHVNRVDVLVCESIGQLLGLFATLRRKLGVTVPVDRGSRCVGTGGRGLAVTHDE